LDKFGYKDFIPLFTAAKFNADEWADLFAKAGARYVMPTAGSTKLEKDGPLQKSGLPSRDSP
jgi:hypothetical protein